MNARWVVVVAACGTSPRPTEPPKSAYEPTVTRERAERALHSDAPLDYERPFNGKPVDRSATTQLFHTRCEGGDPRACVVESELTGSTEAVAANCRKGDIMSCRALPLDDGLPRFADLPGAMSRSNACASLDKPTCDAAKLHEECADGFAMACFDLGQHDDSGAGDALLARYLTLAVEGCRAGIALHCGFAGLSKSERDRLDAAKRLCDLHHDRCGDLSSAYAAINDTTNARDALERACQYGNTGACLDLGVKYVDRELAEPVQDRGQALIDWACPKLTEKRHGKLLRDQAEQCERATRK